MRYAKFIVYRDREGPESRLWVAAAGRVQGDGRRYSFNITRGLIS
jgi:hypothetical protein